MKHVTKHLDDKFIKKWKEFSGPLKSAIKKGIMVPGKKVNPRLVVSQVFAKYRVRDKLEKLIMDNVEDALHI
jgi:hypothetical protein